MRPFFITTVAALGLLASPAFAQNTSSSSPSPSPGTSSPSASNSSPPSASQLEQTLHQDLSKAGYTDIKIIPGSFLVRAKDSKGQMTEMMISPNSVTEITAISSASSTNPSSANGNGSTPKK